MDPALPSAKYVVSGFSRTVTHVVSGLSRTVGIAGLAISLATTVAAQRARTPAPPALPPLSMTCLHHPDVIESRPGSCPFCKMALVPVRLDSAWMCPIHSVVSEANPGSCRLCRRPLVQVTVSLTWACRGEADVEHVDPGPCADGTPRMARRTLRPHGNHNAQHGGQFFMAPDNWHHLEGTYPRARVFRLYLYDDYARALGSKQLKDIQARVVTKETFDPATRRTTELATFPLRASRDGTYLEARVDALPMPAEMTAKIRFAKDAPEYRFDFTFTGVTRDPAPGARPAEPETRSPQPVAPPGPDAPSPEPAAEPLLVELPPATTAAEMLRQLTTRREQIAALIKRGDFGAVWVPAFAAKDLAVALEARVTALPDGLRPGAETTLRDVVRTAWLLDSVGDTGNRQDVEQAYAAFTAAVSQTLTAFAETR
jgi:hypothetical protein